MRAFRLISQLMIEFIGPLLKGHDTVSPLKLEVASQKSTYSNANVNLKLRLYKGFDSCRH